MSIIGKQNILQEKFILKNCNGLFYLAVSICLALEDVQISVSLYLVDERYLLKGN